MERVRLWTLKRLWKWAQPRNLWRMLATLTNRQVLAILVVIVVSTSIWSALVNPDGYDSAWLSGWLQNFSTEMTGAIATFALFELIIGTRSRKEDLIAQLGSRVNEEAKRAAEELRRHGWLEDGSLKEAYLRKANLEEASLFMANLERANLFMANLEGANLYGANLEGANLEGMNLEGANLHGANLEGTILEGANLHTVDLENVYFDETTTLPNGSKWTPETDLTRFTDPDHPDFWRSDEPTSPAYRGDSE